MRKIVLASSSLRRKKLLEQIGLEFEIASIDFEETEDQKLSPFEMAIQLSQGKANAASEKYMDAIIIAADTIVYLDNFAVSKPESEARAREMLKALSGKPHTVVTGFTIIDTKSGKTISRSVETKVYMKKLSRQEIEDYIKTGEPLDKAGAYGIQGLGAIFIERIEGDYNNVVGLPLFELARELKNFGINILN